MYAVDCIELMFEEGILKDKVPAKFFRYLNHHLWDRFLVSIINDYAGQHAMWPEWAWDKIAKSPTSYSTRRSPRRSARMSTSLRGGMIRLGLFLEHHANEHQGSDGRDRRAPLRFRLSLQLPRPALKPLPWCGLASPKPILDTQRRRH
jgi:hypothetical protein